MNTQHSAGPQFLGYLYQASYALYLIILGSEETKISLETLDDIVFHDEDKPKELLQLKHHINNKANLSDTSEDLWKTLRIWSEYFIENRVHLPDTNLFLITNSVASDSSIAAKLSPRNQNRNNNEISKLLTQTAEESKNKSLKNAFDAYLNLGDEQREVLVSAIQILDGSPGILDIPDKIKQSLFGIRKSNLDAIYERLEGWWLNLVVKSLSLTDLGFISRAMVLEKLASINEEYRPGSLPIEFMNAFPPDLPDPSNDKRNFVLQLREIMLISPRIEKAILDYYRAFQERSKWVRNNLIEGDEIINYEATLIDEWERYYLRLQEQRGLHEDDDKECIEFGKKVYNWMESEADFPIREHVRAWHVMRGSYHILADHTPPFIWWHPKFVKKLEQILSESTITSK
jgi:hypothetical protein